MTTIIYPVRASGDGTERIVDAADHVLGTVEIVEALNASRADLDEADRASAKAEAIVWGVRDA